MNKEQKIEKEMQQDRHQGGRQESYWVGIGASAGGLDALKTMCESLPVNADMVYIVAQHLSPSHDSMLTELLQRSAKMRVITITDGVKAKPNVVYVTPPQHDVFVRGDKLHLSKTKSDVPYPKPSVDRLFVSLAEEKKDHAIGVVLSGTGSDGSHGLIMIRASGGSTFAQDRDSAAYDGMPRAAVETNCVDFICKPEEIGEQLAKICSQLPEAKIRSKQEKFEDLFDILVETVRRQCGVSFKNYKKATLHRRIERRMVANNLSDFEAYVDLIKTDSEEVQQLYRDILISVTSFFRDQESFEQLSEILKKINDGKTKQETLRLWVVGCATGEEAYSLAMLLSEVMESAENSSSKSLQIFATDVDTEALAVARRGIYSEASMASVPQDLKDKYFIKSAETYEVIKELKGLVLFSAHNIIEDPPFLRVDLITCRNLLIYFEQDLQKKIYNLFHYSLRSGGFLFLGKSESTTQVTDLFRPIKSRERIFQKRNIAAPQPHTTFTGARPIGNYAGNKANSEITKVPELPEAFVEQLGSTVVLVNENLEIQHIYGQATPFLELPRGKPSLNLGEIVTGLFKPELKPLVFKVFRTKKIAQGQQRPMKIDGTDKVVRLRIFPLLVDDTADRFLLVCFEILKELDKKGAESDPQSYGSEKIRELEDELAMSREHLQTVIEELETSNEELQSMNEELQSANEELQSSNEELETTNEELQSTNEELVTMNEALNTKTTQVESANNLIQSIMNSMTSPLLCISKSADVVQANQSAIDFFGAWQINKNLFDILPKDFEANKIDEILKSVIKDGETRKEQLKDKDRYFWLHATPYRPLQEDIDGAILSFIENTDWVHQREQLMVSQKRALDASVAKSEFLANVSHEIRTPLNAIVCVSEIFRFKMEDQEQKEKMVDVLENSTKNLKVLLDDLLDFAKLEAGQLHLEFTDFSVKDLVNKLVDIYSVSASQKSLKLLTNIQKDLPSYFLGDPLRIQQILSNLLSNAIKFTDHGKVEIIVQLLSEAKKHTLVLQIKDSGVGMDAAEVEKIFEKFAQADTSISRRFGGTGLGLSIVRELVQLMDGHITVQSKKGRGSQFKVEIPIRVSAKANEQAAVGTSIAGIAKPPEGTRILVVEDNQSNIFVFESFLEQLGYEFDIVDNGKDGLELAQDKEYTVILLDLQMPEMNGFEFFERFKGLRAKKEICDTKVIAVTAHVSEEIIKSCEVAGIDDFLSKPIEINEMSKLLQQYTSQKYEKT